MAEKLTPKQVKARIEELTEPLAEFCKEQLREGVPVVLVLSAGVITHTENGMALVDSSIALVGKGPNLLQLQARMVGNTIQDTEDVTVFMASLAKSLTTEL